jgi:mannose-6-phosphate isomerase-like protein (cupin superfamily)
MFVFDTSQIESPIVTSHGETIYEILGWAVGDKSENHSVAEVILGPHKASLRHFHPIEQESYYILRGEARIEIGEEVSLLSPGQIVFIPPTKSHKIYNLRDDNLVFLAICVPAWEPTNTVWIEK